jgi:predicted permease
MFDLMRDVRHAGRRLARTPMFTLATLVTLALGIGANTAIFSIIDAALLKPLPYPEPDRLVGLWQTAPGVDIKDLNPSLADYVMYREESRTLQDAAIWNRASFTVTGLAEPERVDALTATFRLLPMLGVQPILGRPFTEADNAEGSPQVVMLGHGYWQRRFGSDPGVIGRRIMIDGIAREVIGVLPQGFWFMDVTHDLVLPIRFDRAKVGLAGYNFRGVGRLKPGVDLKAADADVARLIDLELTRFPPPKGMSISMLKEARLGPNLHPLMNDVVGDIGRSLWVVMATIGMVLLIACANVANLLLVRTEGRAQELAVRAAIGAGRGRLARELLVESLLLALLGGAAGLGLASAALRVGLSLMPAPLPRLELIEVNGTAIAFTFVISLLAGLAFGSIPVLRRARVQLTEALRAGGRNASAGRDRNVTRNTLTIVQVALAVVLLIGSGLMIRTFQSMRRVQPGFARPETAQTFKVAIPRDVAADDVRLRAVQQELTDRLAALPGVTAAGAMNGLPMTGFSSQDPIFASDKTYAPNAIPPLRRFIAAGPGSFQALGIAMVAGREYDVTDFQQQRKLVVISENFAREYWGSPAAAIGKRIRENPNDEWSEIIGVAADVRHDGVDQPAPTVVYWPFSDVRSAVFVVRGPRAGTDSLATEIRRVVGSVSNALPVTQMRTMQEIHEQSMARTAFTLSLLAVSGGMALLLALVGIYGVISYTVSQRTREIGIRMALGAEQGRVKAMFVRNGVLWAGIGALAGLAAAVPLSTLMTALLFEVKPIDPLTYAAVAAGLLAAAALASYLPARRVTRIHPVEALKAE